MKPYNNEYLKKCQLNDIDLYYIDSSDIDLYELQQSIEENAMVLVDFEYDATIVMTKDEIYLENWNEGDFDALAYFNLWENDDKYTIRDYIRIIRSYDEEEINEQAKMVKRLIEKCKYTLTFSVTKEKVLEEHNKTYFED